MPLTRPKAHQLSGQSAKSSVRVVATSNVTLSGGTPATVDGVSLTLEDRILVTGQTDATENGIYRVTTVGSGSNGTWVRGRDANQNEEVLAGMTCMVSEGTTYADTFWKLTTDGAVTLGTTELVFAQHSSGGGSGITYTAQASAPSSPSVGDKWYDTGDDILFEYTNDGTSNVWVDISSASTGDSTTGDYAITGDLTAGGNVATGNVTVTDSTISATGNITGGNVISSGSISAGGNYLSSQPSFRNLIINGDMRVAQRATSVASITSSGYYTLDRFDIGGTTFGTFTQSQDSDVPTGQGFNKSIKFLWTTANASLSANSFLQMHQSIEGQNLQHLKKGTANAESLTVSFWVKSNKTGTYIIRLSDIDNTRMICKSYTITVADTWEKKTLTFVGDTVSAFDNDNGRSLDLTFGLCAGTDNSSGTLQTTWGTDTPANRFVGQVNLADAVNNYINITGVQLEVGDTATPFEHRPYDVELARCQRYYYKSPDGYSYGDTWIVYQASTGFAFNGRFPVTMRTNPSITFGWSTKYTGNTIYRIDTGQVITVTVTSLPTTPDKPTLIYQAGTHSLVVGTSWSTWITASAEL